jgi:hypothetical protein
MLAYLDDWLFVARSAEEPREVVRRIRRDCLCAHVNINFEKSQLIPAHQPVKHLGFTLDFAADGTIEVPHDRWDHCKNESWMNLTSANWAGSGELSACWKVAYNRMLLSCCG